MKKLNIGRKQFIEMMTAIQEGLKRRNEFNDSMERFCDTYYICTLGDEWLNVAIKLLARAVKDTTKTLEWWLYEDVEKVIYITPENGKEFSVPVKTPDQLYAYFICYN